MIHHITHVTARRDFTVGLTFEGGERGAINLSDFVREGEVTTPLRSDPGYFVSNLRVLEDGDGIGWPNGVEIDADALWYKLHPEDWEQDYGTSPQLAAK